MAKRNNAICKVCSLGAEITEQVERQLTVGIAASEVSESLASQGHKVTVREIWNHREHSSSGTAPKSEREVRDSLPQEVQKSIAVKSNNKGGNSRIKVAGLSSSLERLKGYSEMMAASAEELYEMFQDTQSIRVARVMVEVSLAGVAIEKQLLSMEDVEDRVINICFTEMSLEAEMLSKHYSGKLTLPEDQVERLEKRDVYGYKDVTS